MDEGDAQGMQTQPLCLVAGRVHGMGAVEEVTEDRPFEAEMMGAVDTELMGAACLRVQQDV